jgi:hypothetical protein
MASNDLSKVTVQLPPGTDLNLDAKCVRFPGPRQATPAERMRAKQRLSCNAFQMEKRCIAPKQSEKTFDV